MKDNSQRSPKSPYNPPETKELYALLECNFTASGEAVHEEYESVDLFD